MWNMKDAIKEAASKADISASKAKKFIDEFFNSMVDALGRGETVKVSKLFTLTPVMRGKRRGRNPRTKQAILIKDRYRIKFKPLKNIKDIQKRMTAHLDARKAAETYVSELFLYYPDKVDNWIKTGVLDEFLENKLAYARESYAKRVPEEVRTQTDYFELLLQKMISERKKKLGLQ